MYFSIAVPIISDNASLIAPDSPKNSRLDSLDVTACVNSWPAMSNALTIGSPYISILTLLILALNAFPQFLGSFVSPECHACTTDTTFFPLLSKLLRLYLSL